MKIKIIILGLFAASNLTCFAQTEKDVKSKIDRITVFLQGAQVYRSSAINLSAGITKIVFNNLEAGIDVRSLQASGIGSFIIMDVEQLTKYPEPEKIDPNKILPKNLKLIKAITDSIQAVDFDLEDNASKKQVLEIEKSTLLNNRLMKGEFRKDSLAIVKDALEFLRLRLNNINSETLKLKKEAVKLNALKTEMNERLTVLQNYNSNPGTIVTANNQPNYEVVITVSADAATAGSLEISYLLQNAGWTPSYDLRSKSTSNSMQLTYKANVYQNTGLSWDNVKMKLSTSNPNQASVKPILTAWYLDYYTNYKYPTYDDRITSGYTTPNSADSGTKAAQEKAAESAANFTTFIETATNFEFDIKLNYSIPSDNVTHLVAVKNEDVPAIFTHFAVPKLDHDAFLVARVVDWEDLNLMPGKTNIYLDGTFVGESFVDPANTDDTLNVTLGRDKNIVLTRKKLKDKSKENIILNDKVQTITYEITLKNTKSTNASILVTDQLPVSNNKDIVITAINIDGASYDTDTGLLDWKIDLKTKESKKIQVTYSVKFSKGKNLSAGLL